MKRAGSTLYFALLGIVVQSLLLFLTGETVRFDLLGLSYAYMVLTFTLYFLAIDKDKEQTGMWFSEELRSYVMRKQTSNRLAFAFFVSLIMLPMNSFVFAAEVSRLAFMQMASVLIAASLFDFCRRLANKYYAYKGILCENEVNTKEVTEHGSRLSESRVRLSC